MSDISATPRLRLPAWVLTPWTLAAAIPVLIAILDPGRLGAALAIAADALFGTAPFVAFAVAMIAWLRAAEADGVIARAFEGRESIAIVLAALIGGLAPFCSCEVVPFVAALLAAGAPLSAIMAFWLSSPLIDPPTVAITAAALGWPFAVAKTLAAVGLGLFGGAITALMLRAGFLANPAKVRGAAGSCCAPAPGGCRGAPETPPRPVWRFWRDPARRAVFRSEAFENAAFLLKWLLLAYLLEAVLILYVPANLIAGLAGGDGIGAIAVAALVGMPAYLNGYVAPPLVAGLVEQGMGAGAGLAFLVAGAVSSVPAMAAVWALVRAPVFALYMGLGFSGAVLAGVLFQLAL